MTCATVTYQVGQVFYPTPHYRETIASLAVTPDRRSLVVETMENRSFVIPIPPDQPSAEDRTHLPRLIRRFASRAKTSSA